jgi:hypothetical protein
MEKQHRNSIFGPLLLIVIGGLLLMNTLGALQGSLWGVFYRAWPVLLIIGGLDGLYKRENYVGPVVIIGIGTLILLANLGYLGLGSWQMISRLWPIILVAFGLDLLLGRRSILSTIVGIALGLALIAGIIWLVVLSPQGGQVFDTHEIIEPLQGADSAEVDIEAVAGSLNLSGGASPVNLADGKVIALRGETLTRSYQVQDGRGSLKIQTKGSSGVPGPEIGSGSAANWLLKLNPKVPIDLSTSLVFGEQNLDLSKINVDNLKSETVFGKTELILAKDSQFEGEVSVVFGEMVVSVPADADIRIQADTALTSLTWPQGFRKEGDWILSPKADKNGSGMMLKLEQPFGSVRIQYAP